MEKNACISLMAIISHWVFCTIRTNPTEERTTTFVSSCQVFAPFLKNPYVYVVTNVLLKNRDFPLGRKGTKRVEKSSGIYHLIVTFPKVKESTLNPTFPKGNPPQSIEHTMILIFPLTIHDFYHNSSIWDNSKVFSICHALFPQILKYQIVLLVFSVQMISPLQTLLIELSEFIRIHNFLHYSANEC